LIAESRHNQVVIEQAYGSAEREIWRVLIAGEGALLAAYREVS